MTPLLDACGISLAGRLKPCTMALRAGRMAALIGPNGSGKTSLLRALAQVESSAGIVRVDGTNIARALAAHRRALLSYLPASRELVWPIAVEDVIALGLSRPDPRRIETLLAELDKMFVDLLRLLAHSFRFKLAHFQLQVRSERHGGDGGGGYAIYNVWNKKG